MIEQSKLIQLKFSPSSSPTSEFSKISQKDLILASLLEASGRL